MEQMAAQRQRFMEGNAAMESENIDDANDTTTTNAASGSANASTADENATTNDDASKDASAGSASTSSLPTNQTEYTCCHCLMHAPASEDRPIGLVTLIQVKTGMD